MLLETYRYPYTWTSPLSELSSHDLYTLPAKELLAVFQAHKRRMIHTLIIHDRSNTHGKNLAELINAYHQHESTIPAISDVIRYQQQFYFTAARVNVDDQSLSQFYRTDLWLTPDLIDQAVGDRIEINHQIIIDEIDLTIKRTTLKPQLIDNFEVIVKLQTKLPAFKADQLTQQIQNQLQASCLKQPLTADQLPLEFKPLAALV